MYVKIILNTLMQFSINEHVYNSKIPPIAHKKLLLNLFIQTVQIMLF
jgi:hypothetical protein